MEVIDTHISELLQYKGNPRNNDEVISKMESSIKEFGFKIPILANKDGTIIDGHLRLKAAIKLGLTEVPVIFCDDLSDAQIKAFRILANKSVEWASWNHDLVKLELEDLKELEYDLKFTGFNNFEIENLLEEKASSNNGKENKSETKYEKRWLVVIEFNNEQDQIVGLANLEDQGYKCEVIAQK